MYVAAKDRIVEFHNLCGKCKTRLQHRRWCSSCEREIAYEDIVKGYQIAKGRYVVIEPAELQAIALKSTKAIEIVQFVDAGQIDPLLVERNYYLVPQAGGEKAYSLFHDVLVTSGKVAIGKVVFRNKEYLVAIRPYQKGMTMTILHYKGEIVPLEQLEELKRLVVVKESELKLARSLIEKLTAEFDIEKFKDMYGEAVAELIKKKIAGKEIVGKPIEVKPTPAKDLMEALRASVETIKKKKRKS
jgi:DNA end-binding protein Ku